MTNIFDELKERGLIKQTVYEDDLKKLLNEEHINFYVGFDPTADSLHVGHFTTLMMASRLQKAGHKPYVLIGGGTAMIGDPSGRSDMRPMMTRETIEHNVECFKKQMAKFLSFEDENGAVIVDNADWLLKLNYVDFIALKRDMKRGLHFWNLTICQCRRMTLCICSTPTACKLKLAVMTNGQICLPVQT